MKKSIIIYDNQDITQIGITFLLRELDKDCTIHEVGSKKDFIHRLTINPESFAIIDYTLSDFGSVEELLNISLRFKDMHLLLFSEELSIAFVKHLIFNSQSFSIVYKDSSQEEILSALSFGLKKERFICNKATNLLLSEKKSSDDKTDENHLTNTEKEILKEIALGNTTKEIASKRNLSIHTIITHRKNIFRKLEVNNVHEATKYAIRAGIIDIAEYYI